jgi:hypothetical protein
MVLDAGAYTLSMISRYNSRCGPAVLGFTGGPGCAPAGGGGGGGGVALGKLRSRERLEDVLRFWNM